MLVKGCSTDSITVIDHRENVGRKGLAWAEYMFSYESDLHHNHDSYNNSNNDYYNNSKHVTKEKRPIDLTRMGIIHVFHKAMKKQNYLK